MHLHDVLNPADLETGINQNLIGVRDSGDGQRIYNYTDTAVYTPGAWDNPAVRACRGLIVNEQNQIVARPWAKFFNHNQPEAGAFDLHAPVEVTDKLDGSLGILHQASGGVRVATRGSFASEQAFHATDWLRSQGWRLYGLDKVTPLVEIVYPGNRIVCDYGDRDELVLLGGVNIETGEYLGPDETAWEVDWPGALADVFAYDTLADALAAPPRPGMEGLCVRFLDEPRIIKIKQDDYVALHRIVTGLSERTVWEHLSAGQPVETLLAGLPDELHAWTRDVANRLLTATVIAEHRAYVTHGAILDLLPEGWERRDYAMLAKTKGPLMPLLFQILDGRDPRPAILRNLKPAGDTRARTYSEATA